MKTRLLSLIALILIFSACSKVDETTSYEDMIRGGQWKRTALTVTYRDGTGTLKTEDAYKPMDTCIKDNTLEFKVNYVGTERKGYLRCGVGDPDETEFNWEIFNSGKNLRIYNVPETFGGESSVNADVITLSSNELSIRYRAIDVDEITHIADTVTFADVFRK